MRIRSVFTTLLIVVVLAAAVPAVAQYTEDTYVYAGLYPRQCELGLPDWNETVNVYVASGAFDDVTGVMFRLVAEGFGPEDIQSITAPPGVTIQAGDVFSGIAVTFSSRHLDHDPVLSLQVSSYLWGDIETQDIYLLRGATAEQVAPFVTAGSYSECYSTVYPNAKWMLPGVVDVPVDQDGVFMFRAVIDAYPNTYGSVEVLDPAGWVVTPFDEPVDIGCGLSQCPWNYTVVTVPVHIPAGVADGALNTVTLRAHSHDTEAGQETVTLRAVSGVATEQTTWGRVKALYNSRPETE